MTVAMIVVGVWTVGCVAACYFNYAASKVSGKFAD